MQMHVHAHAHQHRPQEIRRLSWVLAVVVVYMVAEVVGGLVSGSLALLADAGHMFSDAAALALSLFAMWITQRPASVRRTYGYYRAEILAALAHGVTLLALAVYIGFEAIIRLMQTTPPIKGEVVSAVAIGGLLVNVFSLVVLHRGTRESLNVRGAWLHVLTDTLGSVGALAAGVLIWLFEWYWADAVFSLAIGVLVIYSGWQLLSEAVSVLMESVPQHISLEQVARCLQELQGVADVHDLHIWSITSGMQSLSAHVVADGRVPEVELLSRVRHALHDRFGIEHVTIQIEPENFLERGAHR